MSEGAAADHSGLTISRLKSALAGPFDLQVDPGKAVAISGASGSGKSLFLRMIADLDPNDGEVSLDGRSRASMAAPAWRRLVPYVGAESGWWADQVLDHFDPAQRHAARALADRLGVGTAQLDGPVARLSTGERQRLALVRAFVLDTPVLLLDEPTGPLDPASVERVEAILNERLAAGTILVIVTHDASQGDRLKAARFKMVHRRLEPET